MSQDAVNVSIQTGSLFLVLLDPFLGREDEGHDWEIVEEEADVVRTIYRLYLEGYSSTQIAELLTKSGIPTGMGLTTWSSGSVLGILRNEKYCGDALCQKTVTLTQHGTMWY